MVFKIHFGISGSERHGIGRASQPIGHIPNNASKSRYADHFIPLPSDLLFPSGRSYELIQNGCDDSCYRLPIGAKRRSADVSILIPKDTW
jgi:hypothetical protein